MKNTHLEEKEINFSRTNNYDKNIWTSTKMNNKQKTFYIDNDFILNTYQTMDGLLDQYEAILFYEKQQLLKKQQKEKIFEFSSKSAKMLSGYMETDTRFWEFKIENETTTYIRFGKIEPDGKLKERATQKQHHDSSEKARNFVQKLINSKIDAGYVGCGQCVDNIESPFFFLYIYEQFFDVYIEHYTSFSAISNSPNNRSKKGLTQINKGY
ncbi:hypothetical protein G9A89_007183 [Geosiphon pyriformis]|nr:hypothetical protein G9A89_007183 [Geosiphon pyriformis]